MTTNITPIFGKGIDRTAAAKQPTSSRSEGGLRTFLRRTAEQIVKEPFFSVGEILTNVGTGILLGGIVQHFLLPQVTDITMGTFIAGLPITMAGVSLVAVGYADRKYQKIKDEMAATQVQIPVWIARKGGSTESGEGAIRAEPPMPIEEFLAWAGQKPREGAFPEAPRTPVAELARSEETPPIPIRAGNARKSRKRKISDDQLIMLWEDQARLSTRDAAKRFYEMTGSHISSSTISAGWRGLGKKAHHDGLKAPEANAMQMGMSF